VTEPRIWNVVKLRPDGTPATRYQAVELGSPPGWIATEARWTFKTVDISYFTFEPGDRLEEFFSLDRWYNLFAVFRPTGELVGGYCNVTYPTILTGDELHWHDLWVDVIVMPDGQVFVLDEDELEEAGLAATDPPLYATIMAARDELLAMQRENAYPFSLYNR
jgi:protein associated with RNAse G/E